MLCFFGVLKNCFCFFRTHTIVSGVNDLQLNFLVMNPVSVDLSGNKLRVDVFPETTKYIAIDYVIKLVSLRLLYSGISTIVIMSKSASQKS